MPGPTRTLAKRQVDLERLSEFILDGLSQVEMAKRLGVSQQQVSQDMRKLDALWRETIDNIYVHKSRELQKIGRIERMYKSAWEKSCQEKKISSTEKVTGGDDGGSRNKAALRKEERDGNPAFLAGLLACSDARRKLLGLDKDNKIEITNVTPITLVEVRVPSENNSNAESLRN